MSSIVIPCCTINVGRLISGILYDGSAHKANNANLSEPKNGEHFGVFSAGDNFPKIMETTRTELTASKGKEEDFNKSLTVTVARPKDCGSILETNFKRDIKLHMFEHGIIPPEREVEPFFNDVVNDVRPKRQVLKRETNPNETWEDGVFYTFNTSDLVVQTLFKKAVKVWTDATCVEFVEDNNAPDKVVVVKEPGMFSSIGRRGGDQLLSLDKGLASVGSAVHEIGHVLGFFHTMSRNDRSNYVKIVWQNIDPEYIADFVKLRKSDAEVYGLGYDYGSIMHYEERSVSINDQPTIVALDPRYQKTMGSEIISFSDTFMINENYGCNAICNKSTSANCANEGYPHPRNCSVCICPGGYGGTLCDRRPSGCGEDLTATPNKQTVVYRLGFGADLRDQFNFCHYMITAPEGKRIEVEVRSISPGYDEGGCPRGGVEIKAQKDQKLTGYRYCSSRGSEGPIQSYHNRLPLILFNRQGAMQTVFTYRYID